MVSECIKLYWCQTITQHATSYLIHLPAHTLQSPDSVTLFHQQTDSKSFQH